MNSSVSASGIFDRAVRMRAVRSWKSDSSAETVRLGRQIGGMLEPGSAVALMGDLGSGKTTLVKGIALGLGVRDAREVKSPTFVIFHIYKGRIPLYHFDLYRLESEMDLEGIGLDEFLADRKAVSVIEWADRVPKFSKQADLQIKLTRLSQTRRLIRIYHSAASK